MSKLIIVNSGNLYKMVVNPLIEELDSLEYNYSEVFDVVTKPKIAAILLAEIISGGDPQSITTILSDIVKREISFNMALELTINIPFTRVILEITNLLGEDTFLDLVDGLSNNKSEIVKLTRSNLIISL